MGKVEGVVAHETANNRSTILSEIKYMSRNHKNVFVHAFVDHNRVIEIHPTDLGAWGAGRFGNQRFIHVELVRVHSFDQFAKSINNYSSYIANLLYDYNLGVTSAEKSGKGSLWFHKAVSKDLGGTDHVDPHGYFAKYGYNWNDFVKLVTKKHSAIVKSNKANTSKLGHIKSSNVKIYDDFYKRDTSFKAGTKHKNKVYYIKKEGKINGKTFYLISTEPSSSKGTIGWVSASDINIHEHKGMSRAKTNLTIKDNGNAYSKAWGGSKDLVYNLSSHEGDTFKVNLVETVGKNIWARGILSGKQVWIHSSYLIDEKKH